MDWVKRLLAGIQYSNTKKKGAAGGEMYLAPASESRVRAETAMPGTESLDPILLLTPPPIDPELVRYADQDEDRDYGPEPTAEYSLAAPARSVFSTAPFARSLSPSLRKQFVFPTFYVRTPEGRVTFLESADAPTEAVVLIVGWPLRNEEGRGAEEIAKGAGALSKWLSERPEGFASWHFNAEALNRQQAHALSIRGVSPSEISVTVLPKKGNLFDGKKLWRVLHAVGLQWGDGDQFHWSDPTQQTDYLFSAIVDDGDFGYALPEEIAAGRQHFDVIQFGFEIARTPHPAHILQQMLRAAAVTASELGGELEFSVDGQPVEGPEDLARNVDSVASQLRDLGVKPGADSVCMLRL